MPATLRLTREGTLIEWRRGIFDVVVDGKSVGSIELHNTIALPIAPGHHTLQIRWGRYSSPSRTFDASEDEVVDFRCRGAKFWPTWLASHVVPTLAITLRRE